MALKNGLYDDLLTKDLLAKLSELDADKAPHFSTLDESILPDYLTRYLHQHITHALRGSKSNENQYELANQIIELLDKDKLSHSELVPVEKNLLSAVTNKTEGKPILPEISLSNPALFTGATGTPQLGKELELEFETADRIDFLVSFIKNSGLNLIFASLERFTKRGGKLRVITTTYMGNSDPTAIERLSKLPNTEVKVSYDTKSARLHAKAYFIHRESGLSNAYVGSANLSRAAITAGLEWTVKIPNREFPEMFRRCATEFDSYWESARFQFHREGDLEKFRAACEKEKHFSGNSKPNLTLFDLRPFPHQEEVLNGLEQARSIRKHFRNLVIAATGTGKTMIAAFDYKVLCSESIKPKLLFLAHRKELLEQAQQTFRAVLGDANFGDVLIGGKTPDNHDHLFCSIPSFNTRKLIEQYPSDYWDIVILDEAHHGEATSYRQIFELTPKILLGLTATPERADGIDIGKDFDFPAAADIRLPEALERKLLCPFHYYAVSDNVDYTGIKWARGKYDQTQLGDLLTADDARVGLVINKVIEYLPSPTEIGNFDHEYVKGLGFCVSKAHARFMAKQFNRAGIASASLDSDSPDVDRSELQQQLKDGTLSFIFVVDLFNEGVDIPEVNTILFLRPTESHVVYLQQLGRGLRLANDEKYLTVLDFIGESRKEFRFDLRFKSLLPGKRHDIRKEIEHGFPHLPAGSYIHFEKQARERIFNNIKQTYLNIDLRISEALQPWKGKNPPSFLEFIECSGENALDLLAKNRWSDWKELAGFTCFSDSVSAPLDKNYQAKLSLVNSPNYLKFIREILTASEDKLDSLLSNGLAEVAYQLFYNKKAEAKGFSSLREAYQALIADTRAVDDILQLVEYALSKADALPIPDSRVHSPLELHGVYSRQEILSAFKRSSHSKQHTSQGGVEHLTDQNASLHFITLNKTSGFFTESTSYRDYPLSRTLFHWESPNNTSQETKVGQRYLSQQETDYEVFLFVRLDKKESSSGKITSPYVYLGPSNMIKATGNRPIEMVWELEHPMTEDFFKLSKQASGIQA